MPNPCSSVYIRGFFFCLFSSAAMLIADDPSGYGDHTKAEFDRHVAELKKKLPGDGFTIIVVPPFVVVGDEKPEQVQRRAKNTVAWAIEKLKADYFEKDPKEILDIWLFRDKESYQRNMKLLFKTQSDTPFGYYSAADRALVMNISTGGGTLVHEIVHPFVAANFPDCPSWFNEGLASLYEQSGEVNGHIHGFTNWRLSGLQKAIRAKRLPPFKELCSTTTNEFYNMDKGTNYSQARYLCYYLQQKGLLRKFYYRFRDNSAKDPTGYDTLQKILGRRDIEKFQEEWEEYVLNLQFR